jgi:hypothetical protein
MVNCQSKSATILRSYLASSASEGWRARVPSQTGRLLKKIEMSYLKQSTSKSREPFNLRSLLESGVTFKIPIFLRRPLNHAKPCEWPHF